MFYSSPLLNIGKTLANLNYSGKYPSVMDTLII